MSDPLSLNSFFLMERDRQPHCRCVDHFSDQDCQDRQRDHDDQNGYAAAARAQVTSSPARLEQRCAYISKATGHLDSPPQAEALVVVHAILATTQNALRDAWGCFKNNGTNMCGFFHIMRLERFFMLKIDDHLDCSRQPVVGFYARGIPIISPFSILRVEVSELKASDVAE